MPYSIGDKGSYGCSGYPVVKDGTSDVMGCHDTREEAVDQIAAIEANENENKDMGIKDPEEWPEVKSLSDSNGMPSATGQPYPASERESMFEDEEKTETGNSEDVDKQAPCWDGYVQRGMKPGANGKPVPNCVPVAKSNDYYEDEDDVEYENVSKAEGYSPPAGARSAARRAIKFKEDGKATGAGTAVGWTRARQLANGETLSLSTVKRMYSYFSRHEVDKKGKDWGNTANPSNGYIMWLAWGGDAGFSWSRGIVNRMKDKALFSDFGKDFTKSTRLTNPFI